LPVTFLTALDAIGDATCLESIAVAYSAARRHVDDWWRDHLAELFRKIVRRERLTRRHAVLRRIAQRWPRVLDELWGPAASRPARR
jgi:hypothetical protein